METLHGTCVVIPGPGAAAAGVLLRGPSGAGKSDLALRLIDRGATLVADDQVLVRRGPAGTVLAQAPAILAGVLEVRGVGLVGLPHVAEVALALVVDLVPPDAVERLPERTTTEILGQPLPRLGLAPFEASTPAKLRAAVASLAQGRLFATDLPTLQAP